MPENLDLSTAGVVTGGERMDNGESRFRFVHSDGSAYIRTEAGTEGAWQNAHYHKGVIETYVVQSGWMAMARNGTVRRYNPGDVVSSRPGEAHNVYLPAGAVIHTVKHGIPVGNPDKNGADWWPADPSFDAWTKSLEEHVLK